MRHILIEFPTSRNVHIAEELMLPFRGVIKGRVLCGGLRDKNLYEVPINQYLAKKNISREAWFQRVKRITGGVSCKKCNDRHQRFMDEYEEYRREVYGDEYTSDGQVFSKGGYIPDPLQLVKITPDECVLDKTGTCLRDDEAHKKARIMEHPKDRWWSCPSHDD